MKPFKFEGLWLFYDNFSFELEGLGAFFYDYFTFEFEGLGLFFMITLLSSLHIGDCHTTNKKPTKNEFGGLRVKDLVC